MRFQGRIDEQCSSVPYSSIFHFSTAYKSSTSFHTNNYFTSSIQFFTAGTSKLSRLLNFYCRFLVLHHSLIEDTLSNSVTASNSSTFEFSSSQRRKRTHRLTCQIQMHSMLSNHQTSRARHVTKVPKSLILRNFPEYT